MSALQELDTATLLYGIGVMIKRAASAHEKSARRTLIDELANQGIQVQPVEGG